MIKLNTQVSTTPVDIKYVTLYKKAMHIYALSRKLNENKLLIEFSGHPLQRFKLIEEVILLSIRLPYTIALAQTTPSYNTKLRTSNTILKSIESLKTHCTELKTLCLSNKDLSRMDNELHSFSTMFRKWHLILTQQN